MEKDFYSNYIEQLVKEMTKNSLVSYEDLPQFDLFLSQVIDFLNDKFEEEEFTKNIVQNYAKSEVISKPEDGKKRGYTKTHLIQLILISYMRPLLTTEEIKKVFKLAFNEINDHNDDILSWEETYKIFIQVQNESLSTPLNPVLNHEEKFEKIIKELDLKANDEERIRIFLLVIFLISEASAIKKLVQKLVDKYEWS
ncbi:DUF1836 domain-containing protein [Clostridium sp. C2-6-12]|uniref:DUF1836 domain-containing protein n=1 Tax=Clostridium sp. C2-6-12 TaxID=2698832 RepID=UPI00136EEAC5|nr:DUF1836 domain-containing protein [Clostridium sp. C2-6-12]